jgi:hypothetical protein
MANKTNKKAPVIAGAFLFVEKNILVQIFSNVF